LWSTALLVYDLIKGTGVTTSPSELLATGAVVWLGNNLAFAMLYWLMDGGGPVARSIDPAPVDFAFVQHMSPELAPPGWRPVFLDYLHLGFTNATAFSPTDVMPLTHRAKYIMLVQSTVAPALFGPVVARAVNAFTWSRPAAYAGVVSAKTACSGAVSERPGLFEEAELRYRDARCANRKGSAQALRVRRHPPGVHTGPIQSGREPGDRPRAPQAGEGRGDDDGGRGSGRGCVGGVGERGGRDSTEARDDEQREASRPARPTPRHRITEKPCSLASYMPK
jgi:hypothetical protein